jgi:hypothetical protein
MSYLRCPQGDAGIYLYLMLQAYRNNRYFMCIGWYFFVLLRKIPQSQTSLMFT